MSSTPAFGPLQFGVPGATELVVLLVLTLVVAIPLGVGYWIARDARRRGSGHHVAWGAMAFLSGLATLLGLVVFVVFYAVVSEDIGDGPAG